MSDDLLVEDLTVAFDSGGYVIKPLDGLNFKALDGELVVLLGPSGCGKTTLLSCLAGLLTATAGRIEFGSIVVNELRGPALSEYRRRTVGVVFQAFNLIASLSARGNVVVPMRLAGSSRAAAKTRANELLGRVDSTSARSTAPLSCPAASSSEWRSPGRWYTIRPSSWPTSPPPTLTTFRSRVFCG